MAKTGRNIFLYVISAKIIFHTEKEMKFSERRDLPKIPSPLQPTTPVEVPSSLGYDPIADFMYLR